MAKLNASGGVAASDLSDNAFSIADSNNRPPTTPAISGIAGTVQANVNQSVTVSAADPDGDLLIYTINWGDGTANTLSSRMSGAFVAAHTWTTSGTFSLQVTADDGRGGTAIANQNIVVGTAGGTNSGVYVNGVRVDVVHCRETYTYQAPGASGSIWLTQFRYKIVSPPDVVTDTTYDGVVSVPSTQATACGRDEGTYDNLAYDVSGGQRGSNFLGTVAFLVK